MASSDESSAPGGLLAPELLDDILRAALARGAEFADVYAEQAYYAGVVSDDRKITSATRKEGGVGIRVVKNGHTYYALAASADPAELVGLARQVADAAEAERERDVAVRIRPAESPLGGQFTRDSAQVGMDEKLAIVRAGEELAWSGDDRVRQASVRFADHVRHVQIASSYTRTVVEQTLGLSEYHAVVYAGSAGRLQMGTAGRAMYGGPECFTGDDSFEALTKRARENAFFQLDAEDAPRGMMPVVFSRGANGVLFHEACGHGMEADLIERGSAFAGQLGKPVASDLVTLLDDGTIPHAPGSFGVDDEGVPAQKTVLVDRGVLVNHMHSLVTAMRASAAPTGNGRRENYRYPPIPRMRNTYIAAGESAPEAIIAATDRGLYAQESGWGGQVDIVTGQFTTGVQVAWLIEHGRLVRPVRGATISGVGIDVLKGIDMVGRDLEVTKMSGRCGKGQAVPVGVGMPTVRVRSVLVGGKGDAWKGDRT